MLKRELINLVFRFKRQNLIVSVLAEARAVISSHIKFLNIVNSFVDFTVVAFIDTALVFKLFTPRVNIFSQDFVLGL